MAVGLDSVIESIGGKIIFYEVDDVALDPVVEVPHLRGWSLSKKSEANKYTSSSTEGWTGKMMSHLDWSGSFTLYLNDEGVDVNFMVDDLLNPGSKYTVEMYYGDVAIDFWLGEIKVTDISLEVDIETGKPVAATVSFEGHGELTMDTPT